LLRRLCRSEVRVAVLELSTAFVDLYVTINMVLTIIKQQP